MTVGGLAMFNSRKIESLNNRLKLFNEWHNSLCDRVCRHDAAIESIGDLFFANKSTREAQLKDHEKLHEIADYQAHDRARIEAIEQYNNARYKLLNDALNKFVQDFSNRISILERRITPPKPKPVIRKNRTTHKGRGGKNARA